MATCLIRRGQDQASSHDRGEYLLTIPYLTEEELDKIIEDLLRETDSISDMHHCFIEADVRALDGSERSW